MNDPSIALAQAMSLLRMTGWAPYVLGFLVIGLVGAVIGIFKNR